MPAQEGIGLKDEEGFLPSPDPADEEDEPDAIGWGEPWPDSLAVENDKLLGEESVLGNELGIVASDIEGRAGKDRIARWPGKFERSMCQGRQCGDIASDKSVDWGRHPE